jgi:hypothetical protein
MEEFDEFGPGATPKDALTAPGGFCAPAPVTGSAYMLGYPDPRDVMEEAANYLAMFDGQTVALAEGSAIFRAGSLPRMLQVCVEQMNAEAEAADGKRLREWEAHQRRLNRLRVPASVAYRVLSALGRPVGTAAYRLNRAYGFTDRDDYEDDY